MADVPPGVVTVTLIWPVPFGEVAWTLVALSAVMVPLVDPKWTSVAPERLVPVIVTGVAPTVGPLFGLMEVTVGAGI